MPVRARCAAQHRHRAPARNSRGRNDPAIVAIHQPAEWKTEEGVEEREGQSVQQAELGIGQAEIARDGIHHQRQDLAIHERQRVTQE